MAGRDFVPISDSDIDSFNLLVVVMTTMVIKGPSNAVSHNYKQCDRTGQRTRLGRAGT